MPQTIAMLYSSNETAEATAKALRDRGLGASAVCVVGAPTQGGTDAVVKSLTGVGIPAEHATIYADRIVNHGQVLVGVIPPFGYARIASETLQSQGPIAVDLPQAAPTKPTLMTGASTKSSWSSGKTNWSADPAPLSSALGWPTLLSDPAPLSTKLGWATIKSEPAASKSLDSIRKQSDDPAPFSSKLGMAVISHDPAPFSAKLGLRVLSEQSTPKAELSSDPAPLSAKLGWRTLSDDPAPLSTKLGWRTLLDDPAPFSRMLGWKVLSDKQ